MKRTLFILIVLLLSVGILWGMKRNSPVVQTAHVSEDTPDVPQPVITKESFSIEEGETFASVMERMGYGYADMQEVLDAGKGIYDFTQIVLGKNFVIRKKDGVFDAIVYDINSEEQAVITKDSTGAFVVTKQDIPYDITEKEVHGVIDSSLFLAGNQAGLDDRTILELADIFTWEIDFATVIQKGDSFSLVYEERTRDGQRGPSGRIFAATFVNQGKEYTAVRFEDPDGGIGYYTKEGDSLQKPFLKAPLKFSRISSGYSTARFHPVIGRTTTHLAIDYAAPIGTPIMATGDGTVIRASWNGGYGNFIAIRHNDTWDTHYAHLSKYAVKAGNKVSQGDIIGYVGSTGWSTGPHVHYEMVKNGVKVNPLTVELPAGDPIKDEWRSSFEEQKKKYIDFFGDR
ncbi:MAG: peptidase M23 [Candidatus Magasanikbacteria bacterium CG10_big_fil_rev_8_21_14_0_10_42_10]|uniref:Peptidase M23 n=3 Tax=Candidatus Magasanikiibacteriota TaxID=1752731 RepID=A0A2H0TXP5_9BACT|nr:MAG: peptidase M23 [Candidatus Magasanikbacteria bacterium CG10_big_fil_rev_8_21_14_0_10_42_10]PIZ93779.1 MAG: peptidase M23 [Candidatus Magasanikbacteria bacterium CG_4_10_14_0_2_um_filter_41_10]